MPNRRTILAAGLASAVLAPCPAVAQRRFPFRLSDREWRRRLSPAAYAVLRQHRTERPGTSPLNSEKRAGTYTCAGCSQPLFRSASKFDSGTGWPSFHSALRGAVEFGAGDTQGYRRIEVRCARCGGHLGHRFEDGPPPTGLRYCINGAALAFRPRL